jgi:eukaryotic-like serine/threonine-protein kinase
MTLPTAEAIFLALAGVDEADRAAFLDARCGTDMALRGEVDALLSALDAPDDAFLDPARVPAIDMFAVDGPLQPGTRLGTFLVLHALGSGGMGVVYAAQQDRPRRTVAIKVLRRGFRNPEVLRRFEQEAEMLGRLQHPGIAQVYAFFAGDRTTPAHLVMELVAGPPLTEYARAHQLSIAERVALLMKLAVAVQHAHDRGVIHRDLKPANVLIADGGEPKVLDFGIARATGADVQHVTAHGQLLGTLAYMSPEQLRGRSADVDSRCDVYALGVLLYRLLTDRLPFDVADLSWPEAIRCILETQPAPLRAASPLLRGPLEHIVALAMHREAGERYQTAAAFADDLQRFLEGQPMSTTASVARAAGGPVDVVDLRSNQRIGTIPDADGEVVPLGFTAAGLPIVQIDIDLRRK